MQRDLDQSILGADQERRTWVVHRLMITQVGEIFALLFLIIAINIITRSGFYLTWYLTLWAFLLLISGHYFYQIHEQESSPFDDNLTDVRETLREMRPWRLLLLTAGILCWLRSYYLWCDTNGGKCLGITFLANANSCFNGQFTPGSGTSCNPLFDPQKAQTVHPGGVFPVLGQYFTLTPPVPQQWAFCYLDQTWAYPLSNDSLWINTYQSKPNLQLNCNNQTRAGSISIPECNSSPGCWGAYPSPAYGLNVKNLLTNPLNKLSTNLTTGGLCPGVLSVPSLRNEDGTIVPRGIDGNLIINPKKKYKVVQGTPVPICPTCLWYFRTQVAGTPDNPYKDPSMFTIIEQCQGTGAYTAPQGNPILGNYALISNPLCYFCPARNGSQRWESVPESLMFANENYGQGETTASFWLQTTYVFFVPLLRTIIFSFLLGRKRKAKRHKSRNVHAQHREHKSHSRTGEYHGE